MLSYNIWHWITLKCTCISPYYCFRLLHFMKIKELEKATGEILKLRYTRIKKCIHAGLFRTPRTPQPNSPLVRSGSPEMAHFSFGYTNLRRSCAPPDSHWYTGGGGCIRGSWILEFRFFRVSDLRSLIFFELNFRSLIFMRDLRS